MVGALKGDGAIHAVFDRCRKALAIGNVVRAETGNHTYVLDRKAEIGARPDKSHAVGSFHQGFERFARLLHFGVIHGADIEEELFKGLGAHLRLLAIDGVGSAARTSAFS
jgi:hypothetical protein